MSQPEADVEFVARRACCPVCRRRDRKVTVGWVIESCGLYGLARRPDRPRPATEQRSSEEQLYQLLGVGSFYLDEQILRPPIWRESSARVPEELHRTLDRVITCRYGHKLRVPPIADLDLMLKRIRGANDVIYLPAAHIRQVG